MNFLNTHENCIYVANQATVFLLYSHQKYYTYSAFCLHERVINFFLKHLYLPNCTFTPKQLFASVTLHSSLLSQSVFTWKPAFIRLFAFVLFNSAASQQHPTSSLSLFGGCANDGTKSSRAVTAFCRPYNDFIMDVRSERRSDFTLVKYIMIMRRALLFRPRLEPEWCIQTKP